jgi:hypothetical protein
VDLAAPVRSGATGCGWVRLGATRCEPARHDPQASGGVPDSSVDARDRTT